MNAVVIDVRGTPRPQGSMRLHRLPNGGTAARYPAAVYEWRAMVQQAAVEAVEEPYEGPVELRLGFDLLRPAGHMGTGRNAGTVRASAPCYPIVAPDLDKLCRCIGDALTDAGIWRDDSQVVSLVSAKRYVELRPGVRITVTPL